MNSQNIVNSDFTIIIPTLNEEKSIGILLSEIEKCVPEAKIIVSDDGSIDRTSELVTTFDGNLDVLFLDRKKEEIHGLTISVLDAIKACKTPYFLVMDGDLQHPPEAIVEFFLLLDENNDLVAGNRIKVVGKWPIHRKIMSYIATIMGKMTLVLKRKNLIKDIMTGFFGSKKELWGPIINKEKEKFTLEGYKVLFDFLKIYPEKLKINYVDYVFGTRDYGESKISSRIIWLYFKSLFKRS
jgi:dolichol-phosphate mannosyltransferase